MKGNPDHKTLSHVPCLVGPKRPGARLHNHTPQADPGGTLQKTDRATRATWRQKRSGGMAAGFSSSLATSSHSVFQSRSNSLWYSGEDEAGENRQRDLRLSTAGTLRPASCKTISPGSSIHPSSLRHTDEALVCTHTRANFPRPCRSPTYASNRRYWATGQKAHSSEAKGSLLPSTFIGALVKRMRIRSPRPQPHQPNWSRAPGVPFPFFFPL